jgi:hypothetical protein
MGWDWDTDLNQDSDLHVLGKDTHSNTENVKNIGKHYLLYLLFSNTSVVDPHL